MIIICKEVKRNDLPFYPVEAVLKLPILLLCLTAKFEKELTLSVTAPQKILLHIDLIYLDNLSIIWDHFNSGSGTRTIRLSCTET